MNLPLQIQNRFSPRRALTPLHTPLQMLNCLDARDFDVLEELLGDISAVEAGDLLISEGGAIRKVFVLQEGWAIRYKSLRNGRRQILNFLLPGDVIGFFGVLYKTADYGVEALADSRLHGFTTRRLLEAFRQSPRLATAMSLLAGQDERQLDEQIMRIGCRGAAERMAHLFMELHHRLLQAGQPERVSRRFPFPQTILADTLGMSHVHANRSFRTLVREGLVALRNKHIVLLDPCGLADFAGFDATYLRHCPLPVAARRSVSA
jgi:CRP-like cAMP-binding protein